MSQNSNHPTHGDLVWVMLLSIAISFLLNVWVVVPIQKKQVERLEQELRALKAAAHIQPFSATFSQGAELP